LSAYAATLSELGRFDDAIEMLLRAIAAEPREPTLHRQLGAVYTKSGDNAKATEELMVYLALSKGQPAENAPAAANASSTKYGGTVAKTLADEGVPEAVIAWEADGDPFESWFYWAKHKAFHFKGKSLQVTSDWSAAAAYAAEAK
jgi:tetratricopeptide (TPR) repeat protein